MEKLPKKSKLPKKLKYETYQHLHQTHPRLPDITDSYRTGHLPRRDFLRTATLLGLAAPTAYALANFLQGIPLSSQSFAQTHQAPRKGGTIRVAMNVKRIVGNIEWSEAGNLLRQVIEPLTKVGPDNLTRPHLLRSWKASEDLTQWTLTLHDNVQWSNGDPLTADHIISNFEYWLDPSVGSSNIGRFSSMVETQHGKTRMIPNAIEKIDHKTIRLNLKSSTLNIPESLGDYPTLIQHPETLNSDFLKKPLGTGPFVLSEFFIGEYARFHRSSTPYWKGDMYLDNIIFIDLGDDHSAWLNALLSNQVDLLFRLDINNYQILKQIPNIQIYHTKTAQTGVARMRIVKPPYGNKRLRQAITACIDPQQLLQLAYYGLGVIGENHHVGEIHPEYFPLPKQKQDYAKARYLLAEAGYPHGIDLSIDTVAQPLWESNTCQIIKEQLKPAGINLKVNILPGALYWDKWNLAPFGFTAWTHRPLGVQVLDLGYRSGVPWNETGYANPAFDLLLDQANTLLEVSERRKIMEHLEAMLQEDAVILQSYWRSVFTAGRQNLHNYALHPAEEMDFRKVWVS